MTGSLGRPAAAGQTSPATPACYRPGTWWLPGPTHAAPPAIHGWLAGAWVVRCGSWPRVRLAAASGVTGTLALVIIGPSVGRWQPPGCRGRPGGGGTVRADC